MSEKGSNKSTCGLPFCIVVLICSKKCKNTFGAYRFTDSMVLVHQKPFISDHNFNDFSCFYKTTSKIHFGNLKVLVAAQKRHVGSVFRFPRVGNSTLAAASLAQKLTFCYPAGRGKPSRARSGSDSMSKSVQMAKTSPKRANKSSNGYLKPIRHQSGQTNPAPIQL